METQEYMKKNTIIRLMMGVVNDKRQLDKTSWLYDYLRYVTNATTEDDIIPLLRGLSVLELTTIKDRVVRMKYLPLTNDLWFW